MTTSSRPPPSPFIVSLDGTPPAPDCQTVEEDGGRLYVVFCSLWGLPTLAKTSAVEHAIEGERGGKGAAAGGSTSVSFRGKEQQVSAARSLPPSSLTSWKIAVSVSCVVGRVTLPPATRKTPGRGTSLPSSVTITGQQVVLVDVVEKRLFRGSCVAWPCATLQ